MPSSPECPPAPGSAARASVGVEAGDVVAVPGDRALVGQEDPGEQCSRHQALVAGALGCLDAAIETWVERDGTVPCPGFSLVPDPRSGAGAAV
jgi:hypothetical protein